MANFSLSDVLAEIDAQAGSFGVNPANAKAIVVAENTGSGSMKGKTTYSGDAVSPVGASGIMQVMPTTARGLQAAGFLPPDWKHDPSNLSSQVQAGLAAIKEMTGRMNNPDDLEELGSMYNAGTKGHKAYKAGQFELLPQETQRYIEKLRSAKMEIGGTIGGVPSSSAPTSSGTSTAGFRSSTRRNILDPGMQDAFMSDVMGSVSNGGLYDQTMQAVDEQAQVRAAANAAEIAGIAGYAKAAGEEATANAALLAAAASRRKQILGATNFNPEDSNNEMMRAMGVVNSTDTALAPLGEDIDARMSVGFFDNPVEWIINQTRLPGMVSQFNGLVGVQKAAVARFKTIADIATTQQQVSAATEADELLRVGAAQATTIAQKAAIDAAKAQAGAAGATARDALTAMQLQGQKISMMGNALQLTKQSITESSGESDRAAARRAEEAEFDAVNKRVAAAGGQPIANITLFKQLAGPEKTQLVQVASSGKFGKDLPSSLEFLNKYGNIRQLAADGGAGAARWVNATANEAAKAVMPEEEMAVKLGKKFNRAEAMTAKIGAMQTKYENEATFNMRGASDSNPFKLDYVSIAKAPELKGNSVADWINKYGPAGSEPVMKTIDEQFLMDKFSKGIVAGTMTAPVAAQQITDFYKFAVTKQAQATNWPLFGLAKPEKTYAVTIPEDIAGTFNYSKTPANVDLGNMSQVEALLTRRAVAEFSLKARMGNDNFMSRPPPAGVGAFDYKN